MKKLRFITKDTNENSKNDACSTEDGTSSNSKTMDKKKVHAIYHETLYTGQTLVPPSSDALRFRNVEGIESTVDTLYHRSRKQLDSDIERRVDTVLLKQSKITPQEKINVVYVLNKPTPGQVHGDWAVQADGKIFSHHRKKENAIKKARKIALKNDESVLIQNMDGTFRTRYKPQTKKE